MKEGDGCAIQYYAPGAPTYKPLRRDIRARVCLRLWPTSGKGKANRVGGEIEREREREKCREEVYRAPLCLLCLRAPFRHAVQYTTHHSRFSLPPLPLRLATLPLPVG